MLSFLPSLSSSFFPLLSLLLLLLSFHAICQEEEARSLSLPSLADVRETLSSLVSPLSSSSSPTPLFRGVQKSSSNLSSFSSPNRRVCEKNKQYTINSVEDLEAVAAEGEEECLYSVGKVPPQPPIGLWYGTVLKIFDSVKFNSQVEDLWAGKLAFKSQCKGDDSEFHMILNLLGNDLRMPALMYIGTLKDKVSEDDYDDGKPHLFVDYTVDMRSVCPLDAKEKLNFNLGIINDPIGISSVVDLVRYVGETPDGGHILLGKTILRNFFKFPNDGGDRAVAFWYVVSYDDKAYPADSTLPPLPESFSYRHLETASVIKNIINLDLIRTPFNTSEVLFDLLLRKPMGLPPSSKTLKNAQQLYRTAGTLDIGIGDVMKEAAYDDGSDWDFEKTGRVRAKA